MLIEDSAAPTAVQAKSAFNPFDWLERLIIHPAAEMFPRLKGAELAALAEDIKARGLIEPIVFFDPEPAPDPADAAAATRLWERKRSLRLPLLDGRNRLAAMNVAGLLTEAAITDIIAKARVVRGDAAAFVLSANLHRRHLTQPQRRELIAKLLEDNPTRSDRAIAAMANVSHPTVAAVRAEMAPDEDRLLDATGKTFQLQTATSSPPSPAPASPPQIQHRVALPTRPTPASPPPLLQHRVGLDGKARALPTRPAAAVEAGSAKNVREALAGNRPSASEAAASDRRVNKIIRAVEALSAPERAVLWQLAAEWWPTEIRAVPRAEVNNGSPS